MNRFSLFDYKKKGSFMVIKSFYILVEPKMQPLGGRSHFYLITFVLNSMLLVINLRASQVSFECKLALKLSHYLG